MSTKSTHTQDTATSDSSRNNKKNSNPAAAHSKLRGFVFVVHPDHGLLLLHCTRKTKKGPHYQLPGGHVDADDFDTVEGDQSEARRVMAACQKGTARELLEETGLDVTDQLDRLQPAVLRKAKKGAGQSAAPPTNELNKRQYFVLMVNDDDFFRGESSNDNNSSSNDGDELKSSPFTGPMNYNGDHLKLRLSHEHQGFLFEPNPMRSIDMLKAHSGGNGSAALKMSMQLNQQCK